MPTITAQTVMKTNEAVIWNDIILPLQQRGYWIEPLVQIHDIDLEPVMNQKHDFNGTREYRHGRKF